MSKVQNSKLTNLFTVVVLLLTTFQGVIPAMPIQNQYSITVISAVTMGLVTIFTALKQYISVEIGNKALRPTTIVLALAILGVMNDIFNVVHFSATVGQWVRFGLTLATAFINLTSKILFPTTETRSTI